MNRNIPNFDIHTGRVYLLDCDNLESCQFQFGKGYLSEFDWIKSEDIRVTGRQKVLVKTISHSRDGCANVLIWGIKEAFTGGGIGELLIEIPPINYNQYWAKLNE